MNEEGISLEYLDDLILFDEHFVYRHETYYYKNILHIKYNATDTKRSVNGIPTGTTYVTSLRLSMSDHDLDIHQERAFLFGQKERAHAVRRASSILHNITFTQRIESYEADIRAKGFGLVGQLSDCL